MDRRRPWSGVVQHWAPPDKVSEPEVVEDLMQAGHKQGQLFPAGNVQVQFNRRLATADL